MTRNISLDRPRWRSLTSLIKDSGDPKKYKIFVKNSELKTIREFVFAKTESLPRYVKRRLLRHYVKEFNSKRKQGINNDLFANIWLRDVVKPIEQILENCPLYNLSAMKCLREGAYDDEDLEEGEESTKQYYSAVEFAKRYLYKLLKDDELLKELAKNAANDCVNAISLCGVSEEYADNLFLAYGELASYCRGWQIPPPYERAITENKLVEAAECALLRMSCEKWWLRKFKRIKDQTNEHILIAIGEVQKKISPYISGQSLQEWRSQQKANRDYLEAMELVKIHTDEFGNEFEQIISLAEMADASSANPKHRFTELMIRCRGLENLALDDGYIGLFLTLTAPSKYHATKRSGAMNEKWVGNTPKHTQAYLVNLWAKVRAKLKRWGITYYGVRVVEPHHDGTPHWHLLLFVHPENKHDLLDVCRGYALSVDGDEQGAKKHRFTVEEIDPEKGSATGYIAKYLSKNINGEYLENGKANNGVSGETSNNDHDSGKSASEGAQRATAWASRWNLRQFQFFGAEPITIYREARRLTVTAEDAEVEKIRLAVESSDKKGKWHAFTQAMRESRVNLAYEYSVNDYAESVRSIKGLISSTGYEETREGGYVLRKRGSGSPWSPVNNCTGSDSEASELRDLGLSSQEVQWLKEGKRVSSGDGFIYQIKGGQLDIKNPKL